MRRNARLRKMIKTAWAVLLAAAIFAEPFSAYAETGEAWSPEAAAEAQESETQAAGALQISSDSAQMQQMHIMEASPEEPSAGQAEQEDRPSLVKIQGSDILLYYDQALTQPAFLAADGTEYILLRKIPWQQAGVMPSGQEGTAQDYIEGGSSEASSSTDGEDPLWVLCIEALDPDGQVVQVYMDGRDTARWTERPLPEENITDGSPVQSGGDAVPWQEEAAAITGEEESAYMNSGEETGEYGETGGEAGDAQAAPASTEPDAADEGTASGQETPDTASSAVQQDADTAAASSSDANAQEGPLLASAAPSSVSDQTSLAAVPAAAAGGVQEHTGTGVLYVAAIGNGRLLIPPVKAWYVQNDSVTSVLQRINGHTISGLGENSVDIIDGVEARYRLFTEQGSISLADSPYAEDYIYVLAADQEDALTEGRMALILAMAEYAGSGLAGSRPEADEIYEKLLADFAGLSEEEALAGADALTAAMREPETETGEEARPAQNENGVYLISTGGELKWFADLVNGDLEDMEADPAASAVLTGDISLDGMVWKPIGSPDIPFASSFDGGGHRIAGLSIHSADEYQALFGYAGSTASISHLTVSGVVEAGGQYAAGIVAYSEAPLLDLHNQCQVVCGSITAGGVTAAVAQTSLTLENCTNTGSIHTSGVPTSKTADSAGTGGVAGRGGTFLDCANAGPVSAYQSAGGICGNNARSIESCTNEGEIFAEYLSAGGLAGSCTRILDCSNYGTVYGSGIPASQGGNSYYQGSNFGGLAGSCARIENSVNYGTVCNPADGSGSRFSQIGGVAGRASIILNCANYGEVNSCGYYIGGIAGLVSTGVTGSYNSGTVINRSEDSGMGFSTGGIAGNIDTANGYADMCYNPGYVRGIRCVGGIMGGYASQETGPASQNSAGITRCYNLGPVEGDSYVGGIAGRCLTMTDCYDAGDVTARTSADPLAPSCVTAANVFCADSLSVITKAGTALPFDGLRICMAGTEGFRLNFSPDYHQGLPVLDYEQDTGTAPVTYIALPEGAGNTLTVRLGDQAEGLPDTVLVTAGGLTFTAAAGWTCPTVFDPDQTGDYIFTPLPTLPAGVYTNDDTQTDTITVRVLDEEALPLVTALRLKEGTPESYTTDYGKEPETLPRTAIATIGGEEEELLIRWEPEGEADLTDTDTPIVYQALPAAPVRLAEGISLPRVTVEVLPVRLLDDIYFTLFDLEGSDRHPLTMTGFTEEEGVQVFTYDLDITDSLAFPMSLSGTGIEDAYLWVTFNHDAVSGADITAGYSYTQLTEKAAAVSGTLTEGKAHTLYDFAARKKMYVADNTLELTASGTFGEEELRQKYIIHSVIHPTLETMTADSDNASVFLDPDLQTRWYDYEVQVPSASSKVSLQMTTVLPAGALQLTADGSLLTPAADGTFVYETTLDEEEKTVVLTLTRTADGGREASTEYRVRLVRPDETSLRVILDPGDAVFSLSNARTGRLRAAADGTYSLIRGFSYNWQASRLDYVTQTGTLSAGEDEMTLEISLDQAPVNPAIIKELESEWPSFRGNEGNNAVTEVPAPVSPEDAVLYWANAAGVDYDSDAISSPILVDGYVICTSKQNIFKLDAVTGEIVQVGDMVTKSTFNLTPPAYADGVILVALAGGIVQAFNADTLESLWVYRDPLGGQPNSPVTVKNGYIYTGFWINDTADASLVCLTITDENPDKPTESKAALWTRAQPGGFYWAGAYASDRYILTGTDVDRRPNTPDTACLLSLDPVTGRVIDSLTDIMGDVRSTVTYDDRTGRFYFTTKGGYFYSVAVSGDGQIDRESVRVMDLRGDRDVEGMCTSTPVIWNGRAYVGVSGKGQFDAYGGHCIAVIDLETWQIAYTVDTKGYPQTSGLLTTAGKDDGSVYVYFIENISPGTVRIIRDAPGQTEPLSVLSDKTVTEAEDLFTPRGVQRSFALCSPIADEYGTLYFKNDSGHMMALGSRITGIEVTSQPEKTLYMEGETFDPQGLAVTARYANGLTRDVTRYVTWSEDPLTPADTDITVYFPHVLYNNMAEVTDPPHTAVNLKVLSKSDAEAIQAAIAAAASIGEVTLDSGDAIRYARRRYNGLKDALKPYVTNYETLTAAEETYQNLVDRELAKVSQLNRLIEALEDVTLDSGSTLQEAFSLYESLNNYGKVRVSNYARLLDAQKRYEALVAETNRRAADVMEQISALGDITLESSDAILKARAAYDALSSEARALVSNYSALQAAEEAYQQLVRDIGESARDVETLIASIGAVTLDKEDAIRQAREAMDALSPAAAERVSNVQTLTDAEKALAALKERAAALSDTRDRLERAAASLRKLAPEPEDCSREDAAEIAGLIDQIDRILEDLPQEDRQILTAFAGTADQYREALAAAVHEDTAAGVKAEALPWYELLTIETVDSRDADSARFASAISPQKTIRLYRTSVTNLLTGEKKETAGAEADWEIVTPAYNASAYDTIGVVHLDKAGTVTAVNSTYTDHQRRMAFTAPETGLIGVAGTPVSIDQHDPAGSGSADGGSGTTEGGTDGSGGGTNGNGGTENSGTDTAETGGQSGTDSPGNTANTVKPSAQSSGSITGSSASTTRTSGTSSSVTGSTSSATGTARTSAATQALGIGETEDATASGEITSGEWAYRVVVLPRNLQSELSEEQRLFYETLSRAVEERTETWEVPDLTEQEAAAVIACYRQVSPLADLTETIEYDPDQKAALISYRLDDDRHDEAVNEWHAQVEYIISYRMVEEDPEKTAAQLHQYLSSGMEPIGTIPKASAGKGKNKTPDTGQETADLDTGQASGEEKQDPAERYLELAPGPFYAMMTGKVSANDPAVCEAYLYLQAGLEAELVQEKQEEDTAADPKDAEDTAEDAAADSEDAEEADEAEKTETEESVTEEPGETDRETAPGRKKQSHRWVLWKLDDKWYYNDTELDIVSRINPNMEADAMGHFGLDEQAMKAALYTEKDFETVIPEEIREAFRQKAGITEEGAEEVQAHFALPESTEGLASYRSDQSVEVRDGEAITDEE